MALPWAYSSVPHSGGNTLVTINKWYEASPEPGGFAAFTVVERSDTTDTLPPPRPHPKGMPAKGKSESVFFA